MSLSLVEFFTKTSFILSALFPAPAMEFPNDAVKQLVEDVKTSKIPEDEEDEEDREREQRQFREISRARGSYWIGDFRKGEVVKFETTGTTWKPGRIFSERQMHEYFVAEASALCVATQVEGPDPGSKAMLRIRLQSVTTRLLIPFYI